MILSTIMANQGTIEALKQALPPDGATALRLRKALKPLVASIEEYQKLVEEKLKSMGKTRLSVEDPEFPAAQTFLESALSTELGYSVASILTEEDVGTLRVPRKDGTMTGLSMAEIDGAEALGLLKIGETP
jgi:hypothetical protein